MRVLTYAVGAACIASGALSAALFLLWLTTGPGWFRRLGHVSRVGRVTMRGARRAFFWRSFGSGLGLVVTGTLLVLSVHDETVGLLCAVASTALVIFQFGSLFAFRARRRPAG